MIKQLKTKPVTGRSKQSKNDNPLIINGIETTNHQLIANNLNTYFSSVAEKVSEHIPQTNQNPLHYIKHQPRFFF